MIENLTIKAVPAPDTLAEPDARQQEVLAAVLDLMVEEGDRFSMASVARRARCSKETLYNWYGDREGLLTATVQWQAAKVAMPELAAGAVTRQAFSDCLLAFAVNWLTVISSDISAALNRLAISHAGSGKSRLGEIVLNHGPMAMRRRLLPIMHTGQEGGLVQFDNAETAIRSFFGLVVADWQIRKLLGDETRPSPAGIEQTAQRAVEAFLVLYGTETKPRNSTEHDRE